MKTKAFLFCALALAGAAFGQISVALPGVRTNNGTFSNPTFTGTATAAGSLIINDTNPTAPNLTISSGAATLLNQQASDARYGGPLYVLKIGSTLQATGTAPVYSTESVTLPAGNYEVVAQVIANINSGSAGLSFNLTGTSGSYTYRGAKTHSISAIYATEQYSSTYVWRNPWTNIANFSGTSSVKSIMVQDYGYMTVSSPAIMKIYVAQTFFSDVTNPAQISSESFATFRKLP